MNTKLLDTYRRQWPRVAAVQAMALGGASLLAGRRNQANLRALAVMNAMTMCANISFRARYSPGTLTAVLLHLPIGVTYLRALRAQGPISRGDWFKTGAVLLVFAGLGVAAPNVGLADRNSPYPFTERQMGPYSTQTPEQAAGRA